MGERTTDIGSLAAALCGDESVKDRVNKKVLASQMVSALIRMRLESGVSQTALAEKMGCTQPKISKLEAGGDDLLYLSDIVKYAGALGRKVSVCVEDTNVPVSAKIKEHVLRVHELLQELAVLAREVSEDQSFVDKIHEFYGEVLFNFMLGFEENHSKLRSCMSVSLDEGCEEEEIELGEVCNTLC